MPLRSCPGYARRLGLLAAIFITAISVYHIRCNSDIFVPRPYDVIDLVTACSPPANGPITASRIPNLVHQIWKDANIASYPIKPSFAQWNASLSPLNYTVKLWTEENIVQLITTSYPWLLSTYEDYPHNIQRADIARLVVVHAEGGIYADLDAYPTSTESISCVQHLDYQAILATTASNNGISNHFFMAERNSEFLLWALHEAKRRVGPNAKHFPIPYLQVFWSTGPLMITSIAREYSWAYFYRGGKKTLGTFDNQFMGNFVHHAAGRSWHGADGRALNYLADNLDIERRGLFTIGLFAVIGILYIILRQKIQQLHRRY